MADEEKKVIYKVEIDESEAIKDTQKLTTTIESLTKANTDLRNERKKVNIESVEGKKRIAEINSELDKNNKLIKENSSALEKQRLNIGSYKADIVEASKQINVAGVSVGDLTTKVSGLTGPQGVITAGVAIVGALSAAYAKSAAGARDLESASNQLSFAFGLVNNQLAKSLGADGKGGGLLSTFAEYFNAFAFGAAVGAIAKMASDSTNALRALEVEQFEVNAKAKDALRVAEELRRVRDDSTKSYAERLKAANDVQVFITEREAALVGFQERRLEQAKAILALNQDDLEAQKLVKEIEFEIADKREEASGQHTEALRGILALETEIGKTKKAQADADQRASSTPTANSTTLEGLEAFASGRASIQNDQLNTDKMFAQASMSIDKQVTDGKVANAQYVADNYMTLEQQKFAATKSVLNGIGGLMNAFGVRSRALSSGLAIANTFQGVTEILKSPTAPFVEPFASIARASQIATTIATGLGAVARINGVSFGGAAAGGGNFLTKGPTLLMVGDNPGGVERVTVEPLSGRGKTKVSNNGNLIAMAGGGTLTTQPSAPFQTSYISGQLNSERLMNRMIDSIKMIPRTAVVIEDVDRLQQQRAEITEAATL